MTEGNSIKSKRSLMLRTASSRRTRPGTAGRAGLREEKASTISAIAEVPADIVNDSTHDLHSRRLVEYFVVYSCKPRIRNQNSNAADEKSGGNDCSDSKPSAWKSGDADGANAVADVGPVSLKSSDGKLNPSSDDDSEKIISNHFSTADEASIFTSPNDFGTPPRTPIINNINNKIDQSHESNKDAKKNTLETSQIIEEEVTPSRIRAVSSDEGEDQKKLAPHKDSKSIGRGASENIHMPGHDDSPGGNLQDLYFVPIQTARYPLEDHADSPLNPMVSHFCFPNSQIVELTTEYKMPRIHYFVLTNDRGKKMYGTCLTVYEEFSVDQSSPASEDEEVAFEWIKNNKGIIDAHSAGGHDIEVSLKSSENSRTKFIPKVICLLSSWPYLHAFREYISQLYRLATLTDQMNVPIERYILNICKEIPAPPPGSFEIRLKICTSTIRFWAPPANQPIPYVSLPFEVLFECLDATNVLYIWYALNLEQKVLLVSSQYSLLTLCAEILCSLLFPMQWSHLYIPILPKFLSPMLDAPMPYLCGVSRDVFKYAERDTSDETIIVDLDTNVIKVGSNRRRSPVMPSKRRAKLENVLLENTKDIFLNARGLNGLDVADERPAAEAQKIKESADRVWKEKLQTYDDAFNLAFAPNSESAMTGNYNAARDCGQSRWDVVQEGFLRFYVAILEDYRRFLSYNPTLDPSPSNQNHAFNMKGFIAAQRSYFRPFLQEFCRTQLFDDFITKRMCNPGELDVPADVIFFDQSITAKVNRSKMTLKKKTTPFLHSTRAHKNLKTIDAVEPNEAEGDSKSSRNLFDNFFTSSKDDAKKKFSYASWPEKLDPKLFGKAREIPKIIAAEYDQMASLARRFNDNHMDSLDGDFESGDCHPSLAVATFTVYFLVCSDVIGRELEITRSKLKAPEPGGANSPRYADFIPSSSVAYERATENGGNNSELIPNCSDMCSSKVSKAICCDETIVKNTSSVVEPSITFSTTKQMELDEAKLVATAQLDLVFSALRTMTLRKLPTDPDGYRFLMEACGRCGSSQRASQLLHAMRSDGLILDPEIYSNYLTAFTVSNEICPDEVIASPLAKVPNNALNDVLHAKSSRKKFSGSPFFSRKKRPTRKRDSSTDLTSMNESSQESWSGTGSLHESSMSMSSSIAESSTTSKSRSKMKRIGKLKKIGELELHTTQQMKTHLMIGDSLLQDLYEDLKLDTSGDACTKCSFVLSEDQVMQGWRTCSFNDYMTECPKCKHRFVARFSVTSSNPTFIGSQGVDTPLYCEFLSPWVLRKEIHAAMNNEEGYGNILKPEWRSGTDVKSTLWWNLIVSFRRHRLATTFLLQGSYRDQLIMPMPDP